MNESLNDKAITTLAMARELDKKLEGVNDYGEVTGYRDEQDRIIDDFHSHLGSIRARMSVLMQRVRRNQAAAEKAKMVAKEISKIPTEVMEAAVRDDFSGFNAVMIWGAVPDPVAPTHSAEQLDAMMQSALSGHSHPAA